MLKWLRQLLAGDPNAPIPQDATVERDAQGRVVRVQQTLSAASPQTQTVQLPKIDIAESAKPALQEASQWLCAQNIQAARSLGIGLESNFSFDQDDGLLRLYFNDGRQLALPSQLLGSFMPGDRSFMWGWHNPSFQPGLQAAAQKAREAGTPLDATAFNTPLQQVTFETLTPLLAFAAKVSDCDGVYRAVLEDSTSVFIGFQIPEDTPRLPPVDTAFEALAVARAENYDRDQLAQDAYYHAQKENPKDGLLREVIAAKMQSWQRDWLRDDDYWHPCSVGWPSDHDRAAAPIQFTAPHPDGGVLDCRLGSSVRNTIYHIKPVGDEAKIVDKLIEWGNGFIWPGNG
ncbi:hypothetical protein CO610_00060 [Lysobacteraceae bacterium NML95-0200]|nr:hypothetical protein CO610_00060 [Xanthomonadaceae bacterium NML95-0200]